MKILKLLVAVSLLTVAYANTADNQSTWAALKASPFKLNYAVTGDTKRHKEDNNIDGATFFHDLALTYKFTDKDNVRLLSELSHGTAKWGPSYDVTQVRYRRSNLLNQEDHFLNLTFHMDYTHLHEKSEGYNSTRVYMNRTLSPEFKLSGILRHDVNYKDSALSFDDRNWYLYVAPSWAATDAITAGVEWRMKRSDENSYRVTPYVSYAIGKTQELTALAYINDLTETDTIKYELVYGVTIF